LAPPLAGSALRAGNIDQSNCSNLQIVLPVKSRAYYRGFKVKKSGTLTNQIARMITVVLEYSIFFKQERSTYGADKVTAEYSVRLFIGQDLHKAVRVVVRLRTAVGSKGKLANFVLNSLQQIDLRG
jgi:hypothetical protein